MDGPAALRRCLEEMDVEGARSLWRLIAPDMPQPATAFEAMVTLHMARTQIQALTPRQRYYSHRWLLDHNQISQLPDAEKPAAERMYPQVVSSVGIAVTVKADWLQPAVPVIRGAMENAVLEAYADGRRDDVPFIKRRMKEAHNYVTRKLLGK